MPTVLEDTLSRTASNLGTTVVIDWDGVVIPDNPGAPLIEVTGEHSQGAALRHRGKKVCVLNFASGINPGGGVRRGSRAQEEDLCLSSGLLHGLEANQSFYDANRAESAPRFCYDRMIWSKDVPLIRDGFLNYVDPMLIDVITYPAPNLNLRTYSGSGVRPGTAPAETPEQVFQRRCRHVVHHAAQQGTEVLILGAWGCGVYGNDPYKVAAEFKRALQVAGSIQKVVFAILGDGPQSVGFKNRQAFMKEFVGVEG